MPDSLLEEGCRIVIRFGLYILWQCQCNGPCIGLTGEYAHGLWQRSEQLFRAHDAIPIAADRLEAIVDRNILAMLRLKLLQHWCDVAAGKDIAGEQQNRQAIDRC